MRNPKKFSFLLFSIIVSLLSVSGNVSVDYLSAKKYMQQGNLDSAVIICDSLLKINPKNVDAIIMKARIYGWDKEYQVSRTMLLLVLKIDPAYYDAYDALSDIEYWDENIHKALYYVDTALVFYPNDSLFLAKKEKYESLLNQVEITECKDLVFFNFYHDRFDEFYKRRWNIFSVGLPLTLHEKLLFIPKFNWGHLNAISGVTVNNAFQLESDLYIKPDSGYYFYGNMGFANYKLFPYSKAGVEGFVSARYNTEFSLGFRYLYWNERLFYTTFSIAKYWGDYWFLARPFIPFRKFGEGNAYLFNARRYFTKKDYVGISYVFGAAPDQSFDLYLKHGAFNSQKIMLYGNKKVHKNLSVSLSVSFTNEEYRLQQYQNRFDTMIGLTYCR